MDNFTNMENTKAYRDKVNELFKEFASEEIYDKWGDTFEIETVDEKQVVVNYHGTESIKDFKNECKKTIVFCIYSAIGVGKKIKIKGNNSPIFLSSNAKKNLNALKFFALGMVFVLLATAVIILLCSYIGNRNFRETFYSTSSIKVDSSLRVIQLSDMHGAKYGKNNEKLISRIKALTPDIIILTGDIVDSAIKDADYAISLAKELSAIAPSYYIYGNNEVESIYDVPLNERSWTKNSVLTAQTVTRLHF